MNGDVGWKILHVFGILKNQFGDVIATFIFKWIVYNSVNLVLRQTENFSQFTQYRFFLIGDMGSQQTYIVSSIF